MNQLEQTKPNEGYIFYTDGSYCDCGAGAGIYSENENVGEHFALGTYTTVFQAELFAILQCTINFSHKNIKNSIIYIYSDSKPSLQALSSSTITSSLML
jgi:hypothetical protein